MKTLHFLLIIAALAPILAIPLIPSKVIYAIDSGAVTSSKSALGFLYSKVLIIFFFKKLLKKLISNHENHKRMKDSLPVVLQIIQTIKMLPILE